MSDKGVLLMPGADPAIYKEIVENNQFTESIVNGIWTGILTNFFPTNTMQYLLNPEARFLEGRPDMFMFRCERAMVGQAKALVNVWTIIFEGKKGGGDDYVKVLEQLSRYTYSLRIKQQVYFIAARGKTCAFWRYTKDVEDDKTYEQISVDAETGSLSFDYNETAKIYDIVTDQAAIAAILTHILKNPLPVV